MMGVISLCIVLITSIILYVQQERIRTEWNNKLNTVVNQINDSQMYGYTFDKQQETNIQNVDQNITTLYDAVTDAQKKVKFMDMTSVKANDIEKTLQTNNVKTNSIILGNKFLLNTNNEDDWIKMQDVTGKNYYGGISLKNLIVNGNSTLYGKTDVKEQLNIPGGKSDANPNKLPTIFNNVDGKNYIRGDTELKGNTTSTGTLKTNTMKIGHDFGDWTNNSVLTTYADNGKIGASFGGAGNMWSHFSWIDQNTYIRPGADGKSIMIGDIGANNVSIGKGNTQINLKGPTQINGSLRLCDVNGNNCKTL